MKNKLTNQTAEQISNETGLGLDYVNRVLAVKAKLLIGEMQLAGGEECEKDCRLVILSTTHLSAFSVNRISYYHGKRSWEKYTRFETWRKKISKTEFRGAANASRIGIL